MKNKIAYLFVLVFWLIVTTAFGQIQITQFNAEWNKQNEVSWFMDLDDCKTKSYTDIGNNPDLATKHKIAVIPTIIIFKDGEEAIRFQADLSFKMVATKEDVQDAIDELLMSDF